VGIATREGGAAVHVASVVGHVFALYCAFSVQVSEPKIRITVDPSTWHSLTQLSELLTRRLVVSESRAAREALAMLRRLEHEDKAFLLCLGGSVGDYRLQTHGSIRYRLSTSMATPEQTVEPHVPVRRDEEKQDMVLRLEALSAQYNATLEALSQADAKGENALSGAAPSMRGASRSGGRGLASTPSFLRTNRPVIRRVETGFGGGIGGLWNDTRIPESDAWMSRLRQSLVPPTTEAGSGEIDAVPNDGTSSVLGDDVASDLDAALLALEQELVREDDEEKPTRRAQGHRNRWSPSRRDKNEDVSRRAHPTPPLQQHRPAQALSVVSSGHESDGLDELEAELVQDVTSAARPTRAIERLPADRRTTSAVVTTCKKSTTTRPRTPPSSEREFELARDVARVRQAISTMSSTYESDGLDELEAELAQDISTAAKPPATTSRRAARPKEAQKPVRTVATPARRQRAQSVTSIGAESDGLSELEAELRQGVSRTVMPHQASSSQHPPQPQLATRSRAASLVSSGFKSNGLDASNSELEQSVRPQARPHELRSLAHNIPPSQAKVVQSSVSAVSRGPIQAVTIAFPVPRRVSARLSSRSSDVGSVDELLALQRELDAASHPHPVWQQESPQAPTESNQAPARSRKRPAARSPSPETRQRKQPTREARSATREKEAQTLVQTVTTPAQGRQQESSIASIGAESDGLSELEAELSQGASQTVAPHQAPSSQQVPQSRLTTRSRAASLASSGYESDGLDVLNRELEQAVRPQTRPHGLRSVAVNVPPSQPEAVQSSVSAVSREPIQAATTAFPATRRVSARMSSRSSDVGSVDELLALQRELDAASHPHPVRQQKSPQAPTESNQAPARSRKRPAARSPSPDTRQRKQPTPNVVVATKSCSPPTVRRSRRLSIASSARTESDAELAALEAELFAAPKVTPKSAVVQHVMRPTGSQTASTQQRARGLSSASAMTESDEELKILEAELSVNASTAIQKSNPSPKPRANPRAKAAPRPKGKQVAKGKEQQGKRATQAKPRKPRKPKAANASQGTADTHVAVQVPVPATLPTAPATRISSRQSVASTYDSDGLDELDKELRAFH
jgi:hypothetical protein